MFAFIYSIFVNWGVIITTVPIGYAIRRFKEDIPVIKLRKAFGTIIKDGRGINISLPIWEAIRKERSEFRFLRNGPDGESEKYYGPDVMINKNDMIAAKYVNDIFVDKFRHSPVAYVYDTDKPYLNDTTFIVIGSPKANFHVRYFLDYYPDSSIKSAANPVLPYKFVDIEESEATGAKVKILKTIDGKLFESDEHKDYGIVMRIINMHGKYKSNYIFIIAGIHETSTAEAGYMLKSHWKKFVGHAPVKGFLFEMKRGHEYTGKIIDDSTKI